jgi:RNA polymerase-binding transcription factor DksA
MRNRHLTAAQRRELEAELRRERARLLRSVARSESDGEDRAAVVPSPGAVPGGDLSVGLGLALDLRAQAALDTIARALERLGDGTYGSCLTCGDAIPYGRLIALPATEHCVGCRSAA